VPPGRNEDAGTTLCSSLSGRNTQNLDRPRRILWGLPTKASTVLIEGVTQLVGVRVPVDRSYFGGVWLSIWRGRT
jgi:hypothetical protein